MTTVLIIDDEKIIRNNIQELLEMSGYKAFVAEDGVQGLEIFRKEKPEIVVADIKMPKMNGLDVLRSIKKEHATTEVILITGHGDVETSVEAMKEKAFGYIRKPVEFEELEIEIQKALEKQKTEAQLLKLSHAINQSPSIVVITDTQGNIEYVNPRFCVVTGYTQEEVIGKYSRMLKLGEFSREEYKELWSTITAGKEWRGEFHNKKKNGELYWESATISGLKTSEGDITHFIAIKEDITERKQTEMALQDSEEQLRIITSSMNNAIIMIDDDRKVLFYNAAAEKMFGYAGEEITGKEITEYIIPEKYREAHTKGFQSFKETGKGPMINKTVELSGLRKDGEEFPVELSLSAVRYENHWRAIGIIRDISEQKRMETLVQTQQKQLIQVDKMSSLGTMAAGVAHEINNPLSVAIGDIHLLRRDIGDLVEFVKHFSEFSLPSEVTTKLESLKKNKDIDYIIENCDQKLSRCKGAMQRIEEIVQRLRRFSHLDTSDVMPLDINKNIEDTLELVPKKYKHNITIEKNFASLSEIPCYGRQISQVFMNIIVNALYAMGSNDQLGTANGKLTITTSTDDTYVIISISDTGPGIPKDTLEHIFDPFFTTKPIGTGTGLGLSISYSIIEQHGGALTAINNRDKGVTFTVKLLKTGVRSKEQE